jgi:HEAT repeat protein
MNKSIILDLLSSSSELDRCGGLEYIFDNRLYDLTPNVIEFLLGDVSWIVRCNAAEVLGDIGKDNPLVLPTLIDVVLNKEEYSSVRGYAANSIGLLDIKIDKSNLLDLIRVEDNLVVKADLLGSLYWLYKEDYALLEIGELLTNEEDIECILNNLTDLKERSNGRDIFPIELKHTLLDIANKYPIVSSHIKQLIPRRTDGYSLNL